MRPPPPESSYKNAPTTIAIASLTAGIQLWCVANAQISTSGFSAPSATSMAFGANFAHEIGGFDSRRGGFTGSSCQLGKDLVVGRSIRESGQGFKGAFLYGAGLSTVYDSNFFLSENDPDSELITALSGTVTVFQRSRRAGLRSRSVANYSPVFQTFLENPDNNGIDQSGNVKMTMTGAKTVVSGYVNLSQSSGTDPVIGEFVSEIALVCRDRGQLPDRSQNLIEREFCGFDLVISGGSLEGSNVYSTYLSGSWMATEYSALGRRSNTSSHFGQQRNP